MVIGRVCTIPERRQEFQALAHALTGAQTMPLGRLDVVLNSFDAVPAGFPVHPRIRYRCCPANRGPVERYREATFDSSDIVATFDDDLVYPPDYVERGVSLLREMGEQRSVTFGGVFWDSVVPPRELDYHLHRRLIPYPGAIQSAHEVPVLMGGASFHAGDVFARLYSSELDGFITNDDLMASWMLQRAGVSVISYPKSAGWIAETCAQDAPHALWRRDREGRRRTFETLVREKGLCPYRRRDVDVRHLPARVLLIAEVAESAAAVREVVCSPRHLVLHTVEVLRREGTAASTREPARHPEHLVYAPDDRGRLEWVPAVRRVRRWRCDEEARRGVRRYLRWIHEGGGIEQVEAADLQAARLLRRWKGMSVISSRTGETVRNRAGDGGTVVDAPASHENPSLPRLEAQGR